MEDARWNVVARYKVVCVTVSVPAIFKGGTIADGCEKVSRPQPKKNPAGITLEIRFIDVGSENNCRIFRFFDFSSNFSWFTRFQRIPFDFLSSPGLWLLRKSKEILWKRVKYEKIEEKSKNRNVLSFFSLPMLIKRISKVIPAIFFLGCGRLTFSHGISGTDTVTVSVTNHHFNKFHPAPSSSATSTEQKL